MSRFLIFSFLLIVNSGAQAFQDARIHGEIQKLTLQMSQTQAGPQRLVALNSFLDSLNKYLQTMNIDKTPAGQDEFAGLNEFASALFPLGRMKSANKAECAQAWSKITSEAGEKISADTRAALDIVTALCR